jgi:hypothetical protein
MQFFMTTLANLSFDQIIALISLVATIIQALVLPVTIYLLAVQTRAMRLQTTALVEQSKEMTAQTRVFIDTIYSTTFQSLYDAEAHIGELMMTYPEASRFLMSPYQDTATKGKDNTQPDETFSRLDPSLRERVRWLGTALLDFFEHVWTQSQQGGLPKEIWSEWEDYIGKVLSETYLRNMWQGERRYYSPGFRRFVDLKVGLVPEMPAFPPLPRPSTGQLAANERTETGAPKVARVLRAVTEDPRDKDKSNNS